MVANPPYMGSKNMGGWLSAWVKNEYPDEKGDLFACFIARNCALGAEHAQLGFMTPYVWMFIGSYEKLRKFIVGENTITSLIQLEYSGFAGATVPICTFTLQKGRIPGYRGGYVRLSDFPGADQQAPRASEALANPDGCPWFYRADAADFSAIPGSPIAYWASEAMIQSFITCPPLGKRLRTREGMATADNDRFTREWFECPLHQVDFLHRPGSPVNRRWYPYAKGGDYRKWYGNRNKVVDWEDDGFRILNNVDPRSGRLRSHNYNGNFAFRSGITWSSISSAVIHVRWSPEGELFDSKGAKGFAATEINAKYAMALINSSYAESLLRILAPTIDFKVGDVIEIPDAGKRVNSVASISDENIALSKADWDSHETSWDFKRHPLV